MSRRYAVYICGGDFQRVDKRETCPNTLHDWPLPIGYVDAGEMADSRLAHGWSNRKCPDCGIYGWAPGRMRGLAAESVKVPLAGRAEVSS